MSESDGNIIRTIRRNIIVVRTYRQIEMFLDALQKNLKNNKRLVMSIDMEFNGTYRDIALIQLMILNDPMDYQPHTYPIYIFDPKIMDTRQCQLMIDRVFRSNTIRLMHGSDSMDIRYIATILSKSEMKRFCENLVDTLFMCEIIRIIRRKLDMNVPPKACSLYNALLLTNTIDAEQYDAINRIDTQINYRQRWDIRRLSKTQIIYSAMDVAFLFELLNRMYEMLPNSSDNPANDLLKAINHLYILYLGDVYGFAHPYQFKKQYKVEYLDEHSRSHPLTLTPSDIQNIGRLKKTIDRVAR